MTLEPLLMKVASAESLQKNWRSPPPEVDLERLLRPRKPKDKYAHVKSKVDTSPPFFNAAAAWQRAQRWERQMSSNYEDNLRLLLLLRNAFLNGGKVDSHWKIPLPRNNTKFYNRQRTYERIDRENKQMYKRLKQPLARVATTASLLQDWEKNRRDMIQMAECRFVLFPVVPRDDLEDPCFQAPKGVKRPRVYVTLRIPGVCTLGTLTLELFTDVCPNTCHLFTELMDGDGGGYSYVGTQFFRKLPRLYWSGGDVIYDNGFGCYAQRGRRYPIGAENYHFSHSMPGLLSMRMTKDDEMCGIFTITFKALPQLDLTSVVFGRVVRPCRTFDVISSLGDPLSPRPRVEIGSSRRRRAGGWVRGTPNTNVVTDERRRTAGV